MKSEMNVNAINVNRCSNISKLTTTNCLCMSFKQCTKIYLALTQLLVQNAVAALIFQENCVSLNFLKIT